MGIPGTCPSCGVRAPLDAFLVDADARRALATLCDRLGRHPEVVRRIPAYLGLHAPAGRSASWSKVTRLIDELAELIGAPTVEWERAARPCTPELWALAMDEAQDARAKGTLGQLDGHGWLRKVAWTKAGLEEARADAARLARGRGETPVGYSAAHRTYQPAPSALPEPRPAHELAGQRLGEELHALRALESLRPGTHRARITELEQRLAELRAAATETAHHD